jgi:hypothetical protein
MRTLAFSALALGLGLAVVVQVSACSNSSDDCNATATCGNAAGTAAHAGSAGKSGGGSGGGDGGGETGGKASGGSSNTSGSGGSSNTAGAGGEGGEGNRACTGDVADDAACWTTDEHGVFVSSEHGDDATGDGTKAAPFATIMKGVTSAAGKNVYVCVGATKDYAERVSLDGTTDGTHLYGGFDCETWDYSIARKAYVKSPEPVALRIQSLQTGAYIENLRFLAADGSGDDASSYGAFVTDSKNVKLKRVEITAGAGLKGADGMPGKSQEDAAAAGALQDGAKAVCTGSLADAVGGSWTDPICGSKGGSGGVASQSNGGSGIDGFPTDHVTLLNKVQNGGAGAMDAANGEDGREGQVGDPGGLGAAAFVIGSWIAAGYTPAPGKSGSSGFPGQGGGGGGASKGSGICRAASGGAGGLGGCGGGGGQGGVGGGASIGIFVWNSEPLLDTCFVAAGNGGGGGGGGNGGGGGGGGSGGSGGQGSQGNGIARAGKGGQGGPGGNGGSGSGGTGGPSYAIAFSGTAPSYDLADTTLKKATGGAPGIGGQVLNAKAPDGTKGDAADIFEVK